MRASSSLQPADIDATRVADKPAEQAVGVASGLLVFSHDGQELGRVGEFVIDMAGNLTSFIVHAGTEISREARIPMTWIHNVTRDRILLRLTAAEVYATNSTGRNANPRRRS